MKLTTVHHKVLLTQTKCPILKMLCIEPNRNPATKQFVKRFQAFCPYMYQKKMKELQERLSFIMRTQDISKCPYHQKKNEDGSIDYESMFKQSIEKIKEEGRYREFKSLLRDCGNFPKAFQFDKVDSEVTVTNRIQETKNQQKSITLWCSNDYLGMGQNKVVTDAAKSAIDQCGLGAGGTRNIGGTSVYHVGLERELAELHNKQSALLLSSGYVANQAALTAIQKVLGDVVFISDEKNHASLIDGMRSARGDKIIFKHNDLKDLESKLRQIDIKRKKLIVFESVYSMNGSMAPIREICLLAKKYNALTFLDEVHGVGLYGYQGGGLAQQLGVSDMVDFISGTLGKAFGCFGGYIVGNATEIDCIRSNASNFIFTTSIPPVIAASAQASIRYVRQNPEPRQKIQLNAQAIKASLRARNIPILENNSHIVPVFIGDPILCKQASEMLLNDYQIYIQPINYPTVPRGQELLRISPTPNHTPEMIEELAEALSMTFDRLGIRKTDVQKPKDYKLSV